jgi:hypothetical protein
MKSRKLAVEASTMDGEELVAVILADDLWELIETAIASGAHITQEGGLYIVGLQGNIYTLKTSTIQ